MASCFKSSCAIYWIAFLFYIGYVTGLGYFIMTFVPWTQSVEKAEFFITLICYFNICYCFLGCAFVKCDITHLFYTFCYVGPLLFLNVFGTTLGFLAANDAFAAYPTITNVTSVNRFRADYFRPDWLEMVESSGKCCGYWGFWDHPGFIYRNKNFNPKTNDRAVRYIPKECCKNNERSDHCKGSLDIPVEHQTAKTIIMNLTELTSRFNCPFPETEKQVLLEYYQDYTGIFSLNESIADIIHICGCREFMRNAHDTVYDNAHYIFYIINSLVVIFMLFVYIRNWCVVRLVANTGNTMDSVTGLTAAAQTPNSSRKTISAPSAVPSSGLEKGSDPGIRPPTEE